MGPMSTPVVVPARLRVTEGADGVRRFVDPVLRGQVDSILSKVPDVTAVKLTVDVTGKNDVAVVFAVQFKDGWSVAYAAMKPKGEGIAHSLGIQKTFR